MRRRARGMNLLPPPSSDTFRTRPRLGWPNKTSMAFSDRSPNDEETRLRVGSFQDDPDGRIAP